MKETKFLAAPEDRTKLISSKGNQPTPVSPLFKAIQIEIETKILMQSINIFQGKLTYITIWRTLSCPVEEVEPIER